MTTVYQPWKVRTTASDVDGSSQSATTVNSLSSGLEQPDPDAIATQPSVYNPETAKEYRPRDDRENSHRFDPSAKWTREETRLVRKIDPRIMMLMTGQDYNLGNTQLVSKWIGPDRWIPAQVTLWSGLAMSQYALSGRSSFLACRALLGNLQGGFIPGIILYLSYFYKHHEMTIRLVLFWTAMSMADIGASFLAFGLLHLRGGLLTLLIGLVAFILMPPGPCQTASWARGKKGWFTEREETIIANRVIRDDPSKGIMHNREPITRKLLWKSLCGYELWPICIIGLTFQTPMTTPQQYLTLTLRGLGFDTFTTNLLIIPKEILHITTMVLLAYAAEAASELTFMSMLGQIWALPFLVYLYVVDINTVNKWVVWVVMTLLLGYPNVGWNSRNSNTVRSRTVSAAMYNMCVQSSGIIASNIYREDDSPRYRRGSRALVALVATNIVIYCLIEVYYIWKNKRRERRWESMSEAQQLEYLSTTTDEGNKRLDFRLAH
ncbi:major facilitator superfamily domain-containing protein [Aspergillus falconensis]